MPSAIYVKIKELGNTFRSYSKTTNTDKYYTYYIPVSAEFGGLIEYKDDWIQYAKVCNDLYSEFTVQLLGPEGVANLNGSEWEMLLSLV